MAWLVTALGVRAGNLLCLLCFASPEHWTLGSAPVGYWLVADEQSLKPYGVIKFSKNITKDKQHVSGEAFAILNIPDDAWKYRNCTGCIAPFTNKSVIGMNFLYGYTATGKRWNSPWSNGRLFNFYSKNSTYRSKLWLANNGLEMNVRGYYLGLFYTVTLYRISYEQALTYRKIMYTQMKTALSKQSKALKKIKNKK